MKRTFRQQFVLPNAYTKEKTFIFIVLVTIALAIVTTINYYTYRTTAAIKTFISGEAGFYRSQKDAFLYLANYIITEDDHFYRLFQQEIAIRKGDNYTMTTYSTNGPAEEVKKGFLQGRNNPEDLDRILWLYRNFNTMPFMRIPMQIWKESVPFISEADAIGTAVHKKVQEQSFKPGEKEAIIKRINTITTTLYAKERKFSSMLATEIYSLDSYLFWINFCSIILILGLLVAYAIFMISKLSRYSAALQAKNEELSNTNRELDTFVYSSSHDLRSPIASLKGLVSLSLDEEEPATAKQYLMHMDGVIDRLDIFIREMLEFFKNKRTAVTKEKISLQKLVDDAFMLVSFIQHDSIQVIKDLHVDEMYGDELRLKIILNNLIGNAVKYSDVNKKDKYIKITAKNVNNVCIINIEDNGVGIKPADAGHVFDMFYAGKKTNRDTGLGLYIVKEITQKLRGSVTVTSEHKKGSTFTVNLPYQPVSNN